jgi:serine/threonine protein kinase
LDDADGKLIDFLQKPVMFPGMVMEEIKDSMGFGTKLSGSMIPANFEALHYCLQHQVLLAGLDMLARGVAHNDLHSDNILAFSPDICPVIKVIDFGSTRSPTTFDEEMDALVYMLKRSFDLRVDPLISLFSSQNTADFQALGQYITLKHNCPLDYDHLNALSAVH